MWVELQAALMKFVLAKQVILDLTVADVKMATIVKTMNAKVRCMYDVIVYQLMKPH